MTVYCGASARVHYYQCHLLLLVAIDGILTQNELSRVESQCRELLCEIYKDLVKTAVLYKMTTSLKHSHQQSTQTIFNFSVTFP